MAEVLERAERDLKASEAIEHPHAGKERYDAEVLLRFVLGREAEPEEELSARDVRRFEQLVRRRAGGEPPAYITGSTGFFGLDLQVRPGAFIPRESSEWMARQAIRRLRRRAEPVHVDVATGVGPVALAVAATLPRARVFGVDVAERAVALGRRNAKALALSNVTFLRGDLFGPLPSSLRGTVDVVTIHPPYVGRRELRTLPDEIRRFEPEESLTDRSPEGMGLLGRVAVEALGWLRKGGWLLVEVSPDRSRRVATVLRQAGYRDVRSTRGDVAVSRVIVARHA